MELEEVPVAESLAAVIPEMVQPEVGILIAILPTARRWFRIRM